MSAAAIIKGSVLFGHYEKTVDRESAYEKLKAKAEAQQAEEAPAAKQKGRAEPQSDTSKIFGAMAQERGPRHRQSDRPTDHPGRARFDPGRQQTAITPGGARLTERNCLAIVFPLFQFSKEVSP